MSDIQINKIWDYLLSNNELTSELKQNFIQSNIVKISQSPYGREKAFDSSLINKGT